MTLPDQPEGVARVVATCTETLVTLERLQTQPDLTENEQREIAAFAEWVHDVRERAETFDAAEIEATAAAVTTRLAQRGAQT